MGPEATLPIEAAQVNQELFEELQEIVPRDEPMTQEVVDGPKAETQKCCKKNIKKKISHEDVLEEQYRARKVEAKNKKIRSVSFGTEGMFNPCPSSINVSP